MPEFSKATNNEFVIRKLFQKGDRVSYNDERQGVVVGVRQEPALIWWAVLFDGDDKPTSMFATQWQCPETMRLRKLTDQEIEAEAARLHAVGQATVQRMREEHGMTHKFPTGPDAYSQEQVQVIVEFVAPWYDPGMYERRKKEQSK